MDLDEWDLLSDEGFLDLHDDCKDINFISKPSPNATTSVIDMNYFKNFSQPKKKLNFSRVIHVPIQFEEIPDEITNETPKIDDDHHIKDGSSDEYDHQEIVSQVFFKKMKENEFVDMKMESPKSLNRGILPQIDVGPYQEKKGGNYEKGVEKEEEIIKKEDIEILNDDDNDEEGLNVWKWAMTGIGAVFSFGFAAVIVSLIVLGNTSKKQQLHSQFYTHDKRLKQVVHHDTRLNEATTMLRNAPVTRAHITIGGYYEGL